MVHTARPNHHDPEDVTVTSETAAACRTTRLSLDHEQLPAGHHESAPPPQVTSVQRPGAFPGARAESGRQRRVRLGPAHPCSLLCFWRRKCSSSRVPRGSGVGRGSGRPPSLGPQSASDGSAGSHRTRFPLGRVMARTSKSTLPEAWEGKRPGPSFKIEDII